MRPTEIKDLVACLLVVIFFAITIGQYDRLESFARRQAQAALKGWPAHPFFPAGYDYHGNRKHEYK